ncbi:MAG: hypothetical protein M3217_08620, partial [Actinomycetota bacterium]|nr:hypothetical protein [Actinomycetota bacterium]
ILLFLAPWWVCLAGWIIFFMVMTPPVFPAGRRNTPPFRLLLTLTMGVLLVGAGLPFLLSSGMWLPQERVALSRGRLVFGYVLEEEGEWVSVLREQNRELLLVSADDIVSRRVCAGSSLSGLSVAYLVMDVLSNSPARPSYGPCSEADDLD